MITSGFLHGDIGHLFFNMYVFYGFCFYLSYIIGQLNNSSLVVGQLKFVAIYFGSMIISHLHDLFKHKNNDFFRSLGASGALSGVVLSFIIFYPGAKLGLLFIPIMIPGPIFAALYIGISYLLARRGTTYVNHNAHLWGAFGGVLMTFIVEPQLFIYRIKQIFHSF